MLLLLVVLMGKNTMIRKAIRGHLEQKPELEKYGEFYNYFVLTKFCTNDRNYVFLYIHRVLLRLESPYISLVRC